jgi:hypothetical protein
MEEQNRGREGDPVKVRITIRRRRTIPGPAYFSLLALSLVSLSGCDSLGPESLLFFKPQVFTHELFDTEAECTEAQESQPERNCTEIVHFCPDGTAAWLIGGGDIVWGGTYAVRGSRVVLEATSTGASFGFLLSDGGDALVHETFGTVWERLLDDTGGFSLASCSVWMD